MASRVKGIALSICIVLFCSPALAHKKTVKDSPTKSTSFPSENSDEYSPFQSELYEFAQEQARQRNNLPMLVWSLSEVLSDRMVAEQQAGLRREVRYRDNEITRGLDILLRRKGKFAIFVGDPGVGKTEVVNELTLRIALNKLPESRLYKNNLGGAVVLQTSMRNFIPGGVDIGTYLSTVRFISDSLHRPIIVYFKECHFANDYIVSVLREEADKPEPLHIAMETDAKSYGSTIKSHPSFTSIAETIMLRETKPQETKDIVQDLIADELTPRTSVEISPETLSALIDVAPDYRKDIAEPLRSQTLAEDFMVYENRRANGRSVKPSRIDLFRFVAHQIGLPVIPQNEKEFTEYMEQVKERMKDRIIGQKAIVDGVVDQFIAALTSRARSHNIALLLGPTGVGKSLLGEVLAEEFYGDRSRFLELDMTQYKDAYQMSSLFGANNGIVSSDKEKGVLCDFFDGRGKGGGIVVMNEIEEMSADAMTRFMEMWDKGSFPGGDGKTRYVGKTLFILTSNKNSERILPSSVVQGMTRAELDQRIQTITQDQLKKAYTEKASYTEDDSKKVKAAVLERVDRVYFASPLLQSEAVEVANIEINRFVRDFQKQSDTQIEIDPSLAEILTSAFYNESLGARQVRTNVQQYLSRSITEFKRQHGFDKKKLKISANLHPSMKTVSYVTITDGRQSVTIDGPKIPVSNKLLDSDFRDRLVNLEARMKAEIFGQDEAIHLLASSIKARYLLGNEGTAVAGFLLGVTGSGKSELAKVLAKNLYGRKEAVGIFEMGRVQHESDLNTILSPGKGIIGSDQPGELEQFLIQYPEGGVLLFDEMSNVGGGNMSLKQSVAKQFYTMIDEGYYKSPSGKKYSLHNHLIIFTGNDGEEILKGLTSDSMLEETYNSVMKNPQFVKELLSKAGFTDAFIGRLAFSHFMRPTLGNIKTLIAKKLISEWKKTVEKTQPIEIVIDEAMYELIGNLMFSPKTGARSIREFVFNVLGPLVTDQVLTVDWSPLIASGQKLKAELSVSSTVPIKPFYTGTEPEKGEAILKSVLFNGGQQVSEMTADFSKKASFIPQVHIKDAEATAYHEMGHAVTSFTPVTGKKVVKVTIVPEDIGGNLSAAGYTQYRSVPRQSSPDRDFLIRNLAGLLAGSEAESKFVGGENSRNVGRSNDIQRTGEMAKRMILELHLMPELDAAHAYQDSKGDIVANLPTELRAKFDVFVAKAIEDARTLAVNHLEEHWPLVVAGSKFLMELGGNMNQQEYEVLEAAWTEAKGRGLSEIPYSSAEIRAKACENSLVGSRR